MSDENRSNEKDIIADAEGRTGPKAYNHVQEDQVNNSTMSVAGVSSLRGRQQYNKDIIVFCNVVLRQLRSLLAQHDISELGFEIVRALIVDKELAIIDLRRELRVTSGAVSREVSKLSDKGLTSGRRPRKDRRLVLVSLTDGGLGLWLEISKCMEDFSEKLTEGVEMENLETYRRVIEKMLKNSERVGNIYRTPTR